MAYKRTLVPDATIDGSRLTGMMNGIGMLFTGPAEDNADIEQTLVAASIATMEKGDLRVGSVLCTWIRIHSERINVDKLFRLTTSCDERTRAFWKAIAQWKSSDRRFRKLETVYNGPRVPLTGVGGGSLIALKGEDPRFQETALAAPAPTLRDRDRDVLTPEELCARHTTYRLRVLGGPTYRSDCIAAALDDSSQSATDIARRASSSFATAWSVHADLRVLREAAEKRARSSTRRFTTKTPSPLI